MEASLARLQVADHVVPDANRQQTWHLLSFALKSAEAWPATRALLLALAPKLEMAGFRENWIPYLATGCQVAQQQDNGEVVIDGLSVTYTVNGLRINAARFFAEG